jgi:hypothetical protein
MKKKSIVVIAAVAATVTLAGCGSNNFRDVEGVPSQDPDLVRVFNNVDKHPNVAELCMDGLGFATTTRDYTSVIRIPEWDGECAAAKLAKGSTKAR